MFLVALACGDFHAQRGQFFEKILLPSFRNCASIIALAQYGGAYNASFGTNT
jgi:hypothetical protein